jgi:hypothetical protein
MGITTGTVVVPVLALTWFAIVVTTGVRQWSAARAAGDVGARADAEADRAE